MSSDVLPPPRSVLCNTSPCMLSPCRIRSHLTSFPESVHISRPSHTHRRRLLIGLHLLANFHRNIEKLGHTPVQADGFALVQVWFAVVGRDALLGT